MVAPVWATPSGASLLLAFAAVWPILLNTADRRGAPRSELAAAGAQPVCDAQRKSTFR
jgi:hypothetical protein